MGWFEHGTSRIFYEEQGSGDPVLVLPGFAGSIDELAALREALMAAGYRVIAGDLPGSGRSEPQPRTYTATYYEDDARSVVTRGAAGTISDPGGHLVKAMYNVVDNPIPPLQGFRDYLVYTYGEANARVMTQSMATAKTDLIEAGGDVSLSKAGNITSPVLLTRRAKILRFAQDGTRTLILTLECSG